MFTHAFVLLLLLLHRAANAAPLVGVAAALWLGRSYVARGESEVRGEPAQAFVLWWIGQASRGRHLATSLDDVT